MGLFRPIIIVLLVLFFWKNNKGVKGATFTFTNKCDQTIWPGILGTPKLDSTGFELKLGESRIFQAPTGWSGRFWGRTGCTFDGSGQGSCSTGGCGSGEIECNGSGANPPATLAEFTLGSGSQDFYDVSLVDGYNLPMMVDVIVGSAGSDPSGSGSCASTGCIEDLNQKCPKELRVDGGGACRSACEAFGTAEYCCKGEYGSPATCTPSMYSELFKLACPKSYSYAYDDASSTFTCTGADYTITFCPSGTGKRSSKSSDNPVEDGSGSDSVSGYGSGSGSVAGSAGEAMLADGLWLANLATGDSIRMDPFSIVQVLQLIVVIVSIGQFMQLWAFHS